MKILVIGAGIFGCSIASELAFAGFDVTLIEKESSIMKKASYVNHNRLHLGYHYLRSKETAKQSLDGLLSFLFYYGNAIYSDFNNYYAIAKDGSLTSTDEFIEFCDLMGIDYQSDFPSQELIAHHKIDSCFKVPEPVFDFQTLKKIISERIVKSKVKLKFEQECQKIEYTKNHYCVTKNNETHEFDSVINTTYNDINEINRNLNIPPIKLKFQDVVIPVFSSPIDPIGLTVMDGPFCSIMPRGKEKNTFLLYHVKKSVLNETIGFCAPDWDKQSYIDVNSIFSESSHFYPFLEHVTKFENTRTIRAVVDNPNDARVSELFEYENLPLYFTIISGKITTAFQTALIIKNKLQGKSNIKHKIL